MAEASQPGDAVYAWEARFAACVLDAHASSAPPSSSPRTSDSPPRDLEAWRVLLPSHPEEERVARLVRHRNASRDSASDLALLQLRTRVNLTAAPSAVCLPHPEHFFLPGSRCHLARWGRGGARGRVGTRTGGWWGDGTGSTRPRPPLAALSPRTRPRLQRAAGGAAVEQLVVSLPVRPPGGVSAAARRAAAPALPRLPGGGRGGPMLGERQELAAKIRSWPGLSWRREELGAGAGRSGPRACGAKTRLFLVLF